MTGSFSTFLQATEMNLPVAQRELVRDRFYVMALDWYTDRIEATDAAARIRTAIGSDGDEHGECTA